MAKGYFSNVECAGGCGNLLPQRVVDAGKRYLWGHKHGCPRDGEPARRNTHHVRSKAGAVAPAVETGYARMLEMVRANLKELSAREAELIAEIARITEAKRAVSEKLEAEMALRDALETVIAGPEKRAAASIGAAEIVEMRPSSGA